MTRTYLSDFSSRSVNNGATKHVHRRRPRSKIQDRSRRIKIAPKILRLGALIDEADEELVLGYVARVLPNFNDVHPF